MRWTLSRGSDLHGYRVEPEHSIHHSCFAALGIWRGNVLYFVPIYLNRQFLLNEGQIGLVLGAFGFSMAITHIPAGHLADRIGRKPLLITAWLLGLVSTLIMGIALTLPSVSDWIVWIWADCLRLLSAKQLHDCSSWQFASGNNSLVIDSHIRYGHGAWTCDRRLDRRSLRHACEFPGGFCCIPTLEHLYVFHRKSAIGSSRPCLYLHLISITTGSWLSYLA